MQLDHPNNYKTDMNIWHFGDSVDGQNPAPLGAPGTLKLWG